MANRLKMAAIDSIYTLLARGCSRRFIAKTLGIDRETVRRYAELASKPAGASPGLVGTLPHDNTDPPIPSNPATAPPGSANGSGQVQVSACEPFREVILLKLEQGLTAKRIWQDLTADGFTAKYPSVRRYVQKLGRSSALPFRRMECEPGSEAQVDFGQGAPIIGPDGKRKRTHAFRIILSHSRKAYSEVVARQSTEEFIRCIENAFWHFGGVPRTLVIDNLKAAVTKADWFDPDLNPKIREFCRHYGTVILPTRPAMPRHKGKVESGVKYLQSNGLTAKAFETLLDENRYLLEWESTVADTRIHGTTCKQVKKCFEEVERPALLPLPADRFPTFQEGRRKVNRDGHVEVAKGYYSVPPEYLGREVWARWDSRQVWISDDSMQLIVPHLRVEPGRFSTNPRHISARKISGIERGSAWMLRKVSLVGPSSSQWAQAMLARRGIEGVRVLQGLMSLTHRHPGDAVEKACEIAHSHGAYRLRDVRTLIHRQAPAQERFEFAQEHPIIRSLSEYGKLVHSAFTKE
ncbi:MAG TPA: IS21 family transposase [Anaerolineales bacterium]|nr:IS21 family transposase [Anaerolineales bacterium]